MSLYILVWMSLAVADPVERAEYVRLSTEIQSLSERNAWSGVERAYAAAMATSHPMSHRDHVAGAMAAGARGDAATTRLRLQAAHRLREDRKIVEWLWALDTRYGSVELRAQPGTVLLATERTFDPSHGRAVLFAAQSLTQAGSFAGLLPVGVYSLGEMEFEVLSGPSRLEVIGAPEKVRSRRRPGRVERVMLLP
jgi:hypothetical protein